MFKYMFVTFPPRLSVLSLSDDVGIRACAAVHHGYHS